MESGRDWFLNIFKYCDTFAYLKPEQTFGRVKFMLRPNLRLQDSARLLSIKPEKTPKELFPQALRP